MNPNPGCEGECRFRVGMGMTTCVYYPPTYDKHGNNINPDRNTTSGKVWCDACDRTWWYSKCLGETTFKEVDNG